MTGNTIDQIILFENKFLSVENPLKIVEYNLFNNQFPPKIVFEYAHWEVASSRVSNYNQIFACILNDGLLCIWDYNNWGSPYQFGNSNKIRKAICFGSKESIIFSGYSDGTVDFMDMNSFDIYETIKISNNEIKFLESIEGGLLVVDKFQNIFLYNFQLKKIVAHYNNYNDGIKAISITNDKRILAIAQSNNSIKLFDIGSNSMSQFIDGKWIFPHIHYKNTFVLNDSVASFDFSPSNDLIISLMENDTINYIDIINNIIYEGSINSSKSIDFTALSFIDDYNFILGSKDGVITIHNIE